MLKQRYSLKKLKIAFAMAIPLLMLSCTPPSPPKTGSAETRFPIYLEITAPDEIDPTFLEELRTSVEETLNYKGYSVGNVSNLPAVKIAVKKYEISALDYSPTGDVESYQVLASITVTYLSKDGKRSRDFTETATFSSKTVPPKSEEEAIQEVIDALSQDVASMLP